MPVFSTINTGNAENERIDTFGGYNHNLKIGDGEFFDMTNLTSDYYPLLANRRPRGVAKKLIRISPGFPVDPTYSTCTIDRVFGMCSDEDGDLFMVCIITYTDGVSDGPVLIKLLKDCSSYGDYDDYSLFINFSLLSSTSGISLSATEKQMIVAGNRIYIFPDKVYFENKLRSTADEPEDDEEIGTGGLLVYFVDSYTLDFSVIHRVHDGESGSAATKVMYFPCDADGKVYTDYTKSDTPPASPSNGTVWIDTSQDAPMWKRYSDGKWSAIQTYVKIVYPVGVNNFALLREGDGVYVHPVSSSSEVNSLIGTHIIIKKAPYFDGLVLKGDAVVIPGMITEAVTDEYDEDAEEKDQYSIRIERKVPDMDFVVLAQNRLWGCRYDFEDSINEIYASKLGDFTNWNVFAGISTDSYAASVGTQGKWTGAANIGGNPVFFKEDCVHRVYVSSSGAHQIVDKPCKGVKDGCGHSVSMVGDICYYLSKVGVIAYDGAAWAQVSDAFGDVSYGNASGFTSGDKYYLSAQDDGGEWSLFAYDTKKGLWHREDDSEARFSSSDYSGAAFFNETAGELQLIGGDTDTGEDEGTVRWEAVSGLQGYSYIGEKYISRFNLRMILPYGSSLGIFIEYDSDGVWHDQGFINGTGTRAFVIPVRPRRCDHFRIKLCGEGDCRIYSFAKFFEGGSDVINDFYT